MSHWKIKKDPGMAVDNDPPASAAIIGPGFSWHKLPQQKQLTTKRKTPRLVTGPTPMPNTLAKDDDNEPTNSTDNAGRPRWMAGPGETTNDPEYPSQKPGPNGNSDDLFSKNVNDNPPKFDAVDQNEFYIW